MNPVAGPGVSEKKIKELEEKMERWVYLNDLAESIANQQ